MAKDYKKGDEVRLYLNTGSHAIPTWTEIKAYSDPTVDPGIGTVEIGPQTEDTVYLKGNGDPTISFTVLEDDEDTSIATLITNALAGTLTEIAISVGAITTTGNKYWSMESVLTFNQTASRGEASQFEFEAKLHANNESGLQRQTA